MATHTFRRTYSAARPEELDSIPLIIAREGGLLSEDSFRNGHVLRFMMTVSPDATGEDAVRGYDHFWRIQGNRLDYPQLCICIIQEDGTYLYLNSVPIERMTFDTPSGQYGFVPITVTIGGKPVTYRFSNGLYR